MKNLILLLVMVMSFSGFANFKDTGVFSEDVISNSVKTDTVIALSDAHVFDVQMVLCENIVLDEQSSINDIRIPIDRNIVIDNSSNVTLVATQFSPFKEIIHIDPGLKYRAVDFQKKYSNMIAIKKIEFDKLRFVKFKNSIFRMWML